MTLGLRFFILEGEIEVSGPGRRKLEISPSTPDVVEIPLQERLDFCSQLGNGQDRAGRHRKS